MYKSRKPELCSLSLYSVYPLLRTVFIPFLRILFIPFLRTVFIPSLQRILAGPVVSIFLAFPLPAPASLLLRALIPPYFLVKMFSKSFPIQAFVALLIVASTLTPPINATPVPRTCQFLFLVLIDREDLC